MTPTVSAANKRGDTAPTRGQGSSPAAWFGYGGLAVMAMLGLATSGISGLFIMTGLYVLAGRCRRPDPRASALGASAQPRSRGCGRRCRSGSVVRWWRNCEPHARGAHRRRLLPPNRRPPPRPRGPSPTQSTAKCLAFADQDGHTYALEDHCRARRTLPRARPSPPIATLAVKGRAPKTGYDRDQFGQAWYDLDRNGCDTRNDILRRDLKNFSLKAGTNGCLVLKGTLNGPYTGKTIKFVRGTHTSSDVQIDHVVALSDAWQKGAQQMSPSERRQLANDPLNLLAVDGPTNASKGDGDAATWLPPRRATAARTRLASSQSR